MSCVSEWTEGDSVCLKPVDMDLTCENVSPQQSENPGDVEHQTMRVYLRVRPFSKDELSDGEDQDCIVVENGQTVTLNAPKGSATMKSSERGIGTSIHKFTFSQIFGAEMSQAELYENTVKSQTSDFLDGKNALIFSYGVTNAGKTYTIQGTLKEPGILPRVLDGTFHYIQGHQYQDMDVKPFLRNDAQRLDSKQVKQERSAKAAIFAAVKEELESPRANGASESASFPAASLSSSSLTDNQKVSADGSAESESSQFALWVAYFEIYNECVYDLLQPSLCNRAKKRASLRVCDDGAGNAYVKDLRWINVQTLSEASKLVHFGNRNRSAAATKMNQSSSRSHSIFTMKLVKITNDVVERVSEFSLCDLAGSERCNKTKTINERLKEAGNINNSLLILGKCITALRNNQAERSFGGRTKNAYIPFRESKLTKLFQTIFCGRGRASMIVNINQCASTYDETLHAMKFSAVAKQVVQVIPDRPLESPCLVGGDGKPLRNGTSHDQTLNLSDEELLEEEEEADVSLLPQNELLSVIENLRTKLLAERRRNLVQEIEIRKEMGDAMLQQLMESEEQRTRQIEELKESYQDKLENTFEMYKDAIKEHAYQSAMNNLEDDYVPLDEFLAEQEKVEALQNKLSDLERLESHSGNMNVASMMDNSVQTQTHKATEETGDERSKRLYKEKCAVEKMCEDKQQLILSLEKRLLELNDTLHKVRDAFLEKSADLELLQKVADDRSKSFEGLLQGNAEKDQEIVSLKEELAKLSQKSPVKSKTKRGLLANIRDAVTSPRKVTPIKPLRKTFKTLHK